MRLWSPSLFPFMPRQWMSGQNREVCGMRGLGWGRKHRTVDYVWKYPLAMLAAYHRKVIVECMRRKIKIDLAWVSTTYRGKKCDSWPADVIVVPSKPYPEHSYDQCARDLVDLERKVSNPDKWRLLTRDDLKRLRQVGIYLPVKI